MPVRLHLPGDFDVVMASSDGVEPPANQVSAERPATSVPSAKRARDAQHAAASSLPSEPAAKRARKLQNAATSVPSAQSIAFITCAADSQDFARNRDVRALLEAVNNVLEAGATIVNIAFATSYGGGLVDPNAILPKLRKVFDATWTGSVGQPAYAVYKIGSVISFLSCSGATGATNLLERVLDPEGGLPALMLTFSVPEGHQAANV